MPIFMKSSFLLQVMALLQLTLAPSMMTLISLTAFADDGVSAPAVVAPAQPATAAVVATTDASAPVTGSAPQQGSLLGMAMPFVIMLTVMYFLMIRPQQKRAKEHQNLLSGLKSGDEVITNSGILGTIAGMSEKVVTLEVSKNVQIKVLKSQVNTIVKGSIPDLTPTT